jgi:hypothetical protein
MARGDLRAKSERKPMNKKQLADAETVLSGIFNSQLEDTDLAYNLIPFFAEVNPILAEIRDEKNKATKTAVEKYGTKNAQDKWEISPENSDAFQKGIDAELAHFATDEITIINKIPFKVAQAMKMSPAELTVIQFLLGK